MSTYERDLHAVRDLFLARAREQNTITVTKLLTGVGDGTYRGVTVFDAWESGVGGSTLSRSPRPGRSRGSRLLAR